MNRLLRGALLRSTLLLPALSCMAQNQTLQLTLAGAEALARQNNPRITAAKFNAAAAYQVPNELRSNFQPTLTGSLTAVGADSGSRLAAGGLNNPVVYSRLASGLSVSQLVTDFGRTGNLVQSARLRAEAQDQTSETVKADVLLATVRAYFGVLRAQAVLGVAQQTINERQLVVDQVSALAQAQMKSELDLSFARVNLNEAKLLLAGAQNDLSSNQADLAGAMGIPGQTAFTLADEPMPADALPDTLQPLLEQALRTRPELADLRLQENAARSFAQAERALIFPTVGAIGAAGVVPAGETQIPGRYGAVGLNVSIPVFNGGLFKARRTEAELRAKAAAENVSDAANRIARDVRVAWLDASTAFERVGLTAQLLEQARLALDLAQRRYDLGLSSIVELSQAQLNFTSAQIANASARFEYQTQRSVLEYQTGVLR
jgi:outer membrane protein